MQHNLDFMASGPGFKPSCTGIGINTGRTLIGVLGTETRMEPTSIGDTVNLASRTESLCKQYGTRLLITEYTLEKMGSKAQEFLIRQIDHVTVKGKAKPCKIYEVLDAESPHILHSKSVILPDYQEGIKLFSKGHFDQARERFKKCLEYMENDKPSQLYLERCNDLLSQNLSTDFLLKWEGVYKLTEK